MIFFTSSNLALKDLLELIDVVGEEVRHLGHSEGRYVRSGSHGFDCEFLEVKNVIELLLDLVELDCVFLNLPLFFFLSLFNLGFRSFDQHIEEVWINVEILLCHLDDVFNLLVFLDNLGEALAQALDLTSDASLLLLCDLELAVLLRSQLGLLDGIDGLVSDVHRASWHVERVGEVALIQSVNVDVDVGEVGRVVLLEVANLFVLDLPYLIVRHEIDAVYAFERIKLALLLDHKLVNSMNEDKTVIASGHEESLVV